MEEQIKAYIAQVKKDPSLVHTLTGSSTLLGDAGLDSLQMINLILLVERELGVEVDFDSFDMTHINSLGALSNYVQALPRL